jgi:hypothetical protein
MTFQKLNETYVLDPTGRKLVPEGSLPPRPLTLESTGPQSAVSTNERVRGNSSGSSVQTDSMQPPSKKARTRQQMPSISSALRPAAQGVPLRAVGAPAATQQVPTVPCSAKRAEANSRTILDKGDDYLKLSAELWQHPPKIGAQLAGYAAARNRIQSTLLLTSVYCNAGNGHIQDAYLVALVAGHEPLARQIFEKHLRQYTEDFSLPGEIVDPAIVAEMRAESAAQAHKSAK